MRAAFRLIVLWAVGLGGDPGTARADGEAPSWIEPFSQLRAAPLDLRDTRAPLEQRIALADALGQHGPARPAVETLESALGADPPPPSRLREAIARALARRLGVQAIEGKALVEREPVAMVLAEAQRRPPPRRTVGPGAAWIARPHAGVAMVRVFLAETDPRTLRAMVRALAELGRPSELPDDARALRSLCDRKAAPRALLLLAAAADASPPESTRRALRAALTGAPCPSDAQRAPQDDPDVAAIRVLAALALAAIDDREAVPALRHALESPFAHVRLAAAAALGVLATPAACAALAGHARVENSALVRSGLFCTVRDRE